MFFNSSNGLFSFFFYNFTSNIVRLHQSTPYHCVEKENKNNINAFQMELPITYSRRKESS